MPVNKNALRRYILIDRCIRNKMNSFPSRDKLQQKISDEMMLSEPISIETIDKDIKAMKDEYNAPIKYDRNRKGYYYADINYSFDHKISDEDLWELHFTQFNFLLNPFKISFYKLQFNTSSTYNDFNKMHTN